MSKQPDPTPGRDRPRRPTPPPEEEKSDRQPPHGPRVNPDDEVEEASYESFPASDPPSYGPTGSGKPERED